MRKKGFFNNSVGMLHRNLRDRILAFEHYGGPNYKCACCPESEFSFLTIDHNEGKGNSEREKLFGNKSVAGHHFYRKLRGLGFPDGYQVLCMNCQVGRRDNIDNVCPHKKKPLTASELLNEFDKLRVGDGNFDLTQTDTYKATLALVKRKGDAKPEEKARRNPNRTAES